MFQFVEKMDEIKERLDANEPLFIVDVREDDEYASGHLPTAHSYPLSILEDIAHTLPKDQVLYVYCRSGQRSQAAVRILQELGYDQVENIGGVIHWKYAFV